MKILAIGDVCGEPGVTYFLRSIGAVKKLYCPDLTVVNGENASIRGISPGTAEDILSAGADVITLGNHAYNDRSIFTMLDDSRYLIRPANLPAKQPGVGCTVIEARGRRVAVINLIGQVNMPDYQAESPFSAADQLLKTTDADLFVVDFHAEATSEKKAMAFHLDGRASVLFGTHTHIPTADEQVFPGGLGYITDVGMTGGLDSVIGTEAEQSVARFRGELVSRFRASGKNPRIQGALFELDEGGKCRSVLRIQY